tara:strand:- start:57 stop:1196 length:1140 start_codon:yes stop_codon:yes gene_type:complete
MENQLYHTAQPEAIQTGGYKQYNNVDFIINVGEGRSLVKNSVRIRGEIGINSDNSVPTRVVAADNIFLGNRIGIHNTIDSIQVTFNGGPSSGLKENIQNYPRFAEMISVGQLYPDDLLNCSNMCELRTINNKSSQVNSVGLITGSPAGQSTVIVKNNDFSFKPYCILNRMTGDDLPMEKSGEIRLTANLARDIGALMGVDQSDASGYTLFNLECTYISVPTEASNPLTVMNSVYNVKSTILSGTTNVSAQVPAICQSVSCTFQTQSNENANFVNCQALEQLPGISRVQFLFNDATNQYVTYQISDQNEMLHRYIDSFSNTGHNMVYGDQFRTNSGFGIGLDFNGSVDLSNQRFAVQLDSDVSAARPVNIYLYFHSVMSI